MKKVLVVILIIFCLLAASGRSCTNPDTGGDLVPGITGDALEVDKGFIDVTITVPASMVGLEDTETITEEAREKGIKEVAVNDNGSVTYKMCRSAYKEIMQELYDSFSQRVTDLIGAGAFKSIEDVKFNRHLTTITLVVEREAFENNPDDLAIFGLAFAAAYYQRFDGVREENIKVFFNLKDSATGEIFKTITVPGTSTLST